MTAADFGAGPPAVHRQEQFLEVVSRDEAMRRFTAALDLSPMPAESVTLEGARGRVLACDVHAPVDVPGFDRSNVDGFALRGQDTRDAAPDRPAMLLLNAEAIACGHAPQLAVQPGTATLIATGGMIPRGADAVVMVEATDPARDDRSAIAIARPVVPGQFVTFAGSDIARGELVLRTGTVIGPREIGMLAAIGCDRVAVVRRPRVAVLSTGDELVVPGAAIAPGQVFDSNRAILAACVAENGGEAVDFGVVRDDFAALSQALARAIAQCDIVILSGGTSKGVGDISYRVVSQLRPPGVLVHGVAIKPGKPLCLAVSGNTPVAVLPGFPTSAMFTFHAFVSPVIRARADLPPREEHAVDATLAVRLPSELGRTEFAMVALGDGANGPVAYPLAKGSGAVTAFSQADGFVEIPDLTSERAAGAAVRVTLLAQDARPPDLMIVGSHCIGLDIVLSRLGRLRARVVAVGSLGGLAAARRGECDLAPIHLLDDSTGRYNLDFLSDGIDLVRGWRRMQGIVFRRGDPRFAGLDASAAIAAALADPDCILANRNAGSGTRILLDGLLNGARPRGYDNQPRSHNAVAAAIAQGRADWGMAISPVADAYGLGFIPFAEEHYDFAVPRDRLQRPAVQAFLALLATADVADQLRRAGFSCGDAP